MRRPLLSTAVAKTALLITAAPALACGGLIGPNGAVNLLRTTTFAGYDDGVEHYITSFEFAGGGGAFGSITPLPGIPSNVERGGDWTLQRLVRETDPVDELAFRLQAGADASGESAEVLEAHRTGSHATHDEVPTEVTVRALETVTTTVTFVEAGSLSYICHFPAHEAYGMIGILTVEG